MKRFLFGLVVCLAAPAVTWAVAPKAVIVCPASVPVGTPILLDGSQSQGDTPCKWKLKKGPSNTLNIYNQTAPDGKTERHNILAVVPKAEAGTYSFVLIVGGKDEAGNLDYDFDFADITVGQLPPGPTPPGPVPPPPPPLPPNDPLAQAIQAAYAKDTDAGKAGYAAFLSALFQGAPSLLTADVATYQQLHDKLKAAIRAPGVGLPAGKLPNTMAAVEAEIDARFGNVLATPVDAAVVKATFAHLEAALAAVK